jgi:hypothetical protein
MWWFLAPVHHFTVKSNVILREKSQIWHLKKFTRFCCLQCDDVVLEDTGILIWCTVILERAESLREGHL